MSMSTIAPDSACEDARYAARIRRVEAVLASLRELRSAATGRSGRPAGIEVTIADYERELAVLERRLSAMQR